MATETELEPADFACRVCLNEGFDGGDLIRPCKCKGTQAFIHVECLEEWRATRLANRAVCPTCRSAYHKKFLTKAERCLAFSQKNSRLFFYMLFVPLSACAICFTVDQDDRHALGIEKEVNCRQRWGLNELHPSDAKYGHSMCLSRFEPKVKSLFGLSMSQCFDEYFVGREPWELHFCVLYAQRSPDPSAASLQQRQWILRRIETALAGCCAGQFRHIEDRCSGFNFAQFSDDVRATCHLKTAAERWHHIESLPDEAVWALHKTTPPF